MVNRPNRLRRVNEHTCWLLAIVLCVAGVAGCGGGGSSGAPASQPQATPAPAPAPPAEEGELVVSLTDAEGDFLSYTVDVSSIRLTAVNGDTVDVLPASTRVNFAELTELAELLTQRTLPAGVYDTITVALDYSNAEVVIQDDSGAPLTAQLQDEAGNPLTMASAALQLGDAQMVRITRGTIASVALDFDLDASNTIVSTSPAIVQVAPLLVAEPQLLTDREHRVRGLLDTVDTNAGVINIDVRPFARRDGGFGSIGVGVQDSTSYEINGEMFTGTDGLEALAALAAGEPLVAQGMVAGGRVVADRVAAGSSLPFAGLDIADGVITARSAESATLRGAHFESRTGGITFRDRITLTFGVDTTVSVAGVGPSTIAALAPGQRVRAFGAFTDDTLDASDGHVRVPVGGLFGNVVTADPLSVELTLLNRLRPAAISFVGTGMTADVDANPTDYQIDTGALAATLEAGDLVQVRGQVGDFGFAPPDFRATTVVDLNITERAARANVRWAIDAESRITSTSPDRITLDTESASLRVVLRGLPRSDAGDRTLVELVAPSGTGSYALRERGQPQVRVFATFAAFSAALAETLEGGATVVRLDAEGRYASATMSLTARNVRVITAPPAQS